MTSKYKLKMAFIFLNASYGKCPKILKTKVSDKMTYANSADPEEQSDQGLHCLPYH